MYCFLCIVSIFNDLSLMHAYDWSNNIFLSMATCKGCMLAKLQVQSLSSLTSMPHEQNVYDTVLRNLHWHRPNVLPVLRHAYVRVSDPGNAAARLHPYQLQRPAVVEIDDTDATRFLLKAWHSFSFFEKESIPTRDPTCTPYPGLYIDRCAHPF